MGRLRRFEAHRYLGTRDDMRFYDCDDARQFATLEARAADEDLVGHNLISAIAPDTPAEARNRGYRAVRTIDED
jgi:hypothetical protein